MEHVGRFHAVLFFDLYISDKITPYPYQYQHLVALMLIMIT